MSADIAATADRPVVWPHGDVRLASLALRELRRSYAAFLNLIASIALGVAVIAGVGALSDALRAGFERQGRTLLGGDVTLSRSHREATAGERAWLAARGQLSETATMRSMARPPGGGDQVLVELKGVDGAYPLAGELRVAGAEPAANLLASKAAAIVDPILLPRLGVKVGDQIELGRTRVEIRGLLEAEPDKIADRFTTGPRVLVSRQTLDATGLAEPGSLVRWRYALAFPGVADKAALKAFQDAAKAELPESGFIINDRLNPSPALTRTLDQLRQFLTLIGLASLMIGGVGVANAVSAYVERRRKVIAAMKSLGASSRQIFLLHVVQILALAAVGIAIGLAVGALLPLALDRALAGVLPVRIALGVNGGTLALAAAYGLLVALLFSLWPLGRAGEIRAAALFRDEVAPQRRLPPAAIIAGTAAIAMLLVGLAVVTSDSRRLALAFCAGVAAVFIIFPLVGSLIAWGAGRVPRPRHPALALALANLGAPGGLTRSVVLSLGAGLSLLTGVALVDAAIVRELATRLPQNSPDYFMLDIPKAEMAALSGQIHKVLPGSEVATAPMLRGRLVALGGRRVEDIKAPPEAQWVLRGDRGLTYSDTVPAGSTVVAGQWWATGYTGEALVSFEAELARHLRVGIGDSVTVNVLGRDVTARIANLREVQWESLGINFVLVFSPNVLHAAPHNLLATVTLPKSTPLELEAQMARDLGRAHPSVTVIRVRDAIEAFNAVFRKVMTAVRLAGGVTLLAGGLVLAGALATAQRQRIRLAVILKAIGGTRRDILTMHLAEYVILACATAAVAVVVGAIGAWATLAYLIKIPFSFSLAAVAQALAVSIGLVMGLGLAGSARVLKAPPIPYLRGE